MTHGRKAKADFSVRKESEGKLLTRISDHALKSLETKLASLEARVVELEERVDRLDGIAPSYYYGGTDSSRRNLARTGTLKMLNSSATATAL